MESQLGIGAVLQWGKHQILATRPVVSDRSPGPSAIQKRIPTKTDSSEISEVFVKRKKSTVHVDRHTGELRERVSELHPWGSFSYFSDIFLPSSF